MLMSIGEESHRITPVGQGEAGELTHALSILVHKTFVGSGINSHAQTTQFQDALVHRPSPARGHSCIMNYFPGR